MSKKQFHHGDTVYNIFGQAGSYIAPSHLSGHLVEPIFDDEDDEPHYSRAETWTEVFTKVPEARFNDRIAELNSEVSEQEKHLQNLREEQRQVEAQTKAAQERIKAHPQLRDLDLWLSGAVTHLVEIEYYSFKIGAVDEILKGDGRDNEMRLLSLFGGTRGHYRWKMAAYSDGSGSYKTVLLATSLEDAKRLALEYIIKEIPIMQRNGHKSNAVGMARCAIRYGLPVTEELRKEVEKEDRDGHERSIKSARDELSRVQSRLAALEQQGQAA